jgi:hypothetical protein
MSRKAVRVELDGSLIYPTVAGKYRASSRPRHKFGAALAISHRQEAVEDEMTGVIAYGRRPLPGHAE